MSYQIYFLQDEDDAVQFLDKLSELHAIVWTGNAFRLPAELKNNMKDRMSSLVCKYTIVPQTEMDILRSNDKEVSADIIGIEFLACCKKNALSRTYEVGRLYYKGNEDNSYNEQMMTLYGELKKFIRKNYSFSQSARVYIAPHFKQRYEDNYLVATQLGRPLTL